MSEARTGKRFPLELPITIRTEESGAARSGPRSGKGTTADVSAAGVYIRSATPLKVGATVRFEITLPAKVVGADKDVTISCKGRVVRAEDSGKGKRGQNGKAGKAGSKTGIACVIDQYKFVRKAAGK